MNTVSSLADRNLTKTQTLVSRATRALEACTRARTLPCTGNEGAKLLRTGRGGRERAPEAVVLEEDIVRLKHHQLGVALLLDILSHSHTQQVLEGGDVQPLAAAGVCMPWAAGKPLRCASQTLK